jgi:hypothetical protein
VESRQTSHENTGRNNGISKAIFGRNSSGLYAQVVARSFNRHQGTVVEKYAIIDREKK